MHFLRRQVSRCMLGPVALYPAASAHMPPCIISIDFFCKGNVYLVILHHGQRALTVHIGDARAAKKHHVHIRHMCRLTMLDAAP